MDESTPKTTTYTEPVEDEHAEPQPVAEESDFERRAKALKVAREALIPSAIFGTPKTPNPLDLILLADWLLGEFDYVAEEALIEAEEKGDS